MGARPVERLLIILQTECREVWSAARCQWLVGVGDVCSVEPSAKDLHES